MADYYVNHGDSSSPDWVATTPIGGAYDPVNSGVSGDTGYDTGTIWLWVGHGAWVNSGTALVPRWHYLMYSAYDPITAADRAPSNVPAATNSVRALTVPSAASLPAISGQWSMATTDEEWAAFPNPPAAGSVTLDFDATEAEVVAALQALYGAAQVSASGYNPMQVEFVGVLAGAPALTIPLHLGSTNTLKGAADWQPSHTYAPGALVSPTVANGCVYQQSGTQDMVSGAAEPTWLLDGPTDDGTGSWLPLSLTFDHEVDVSGGPGVGQDYLSPDTVWADFSAGDIYRNQSIALFSPDWQLDAAIVRHTDTRAPANPTGLATPGDAFALWINSLTGDVFVNVGSSAAPDWQPQEPTNQSRPPRSSLDSAVVYPPSLAGTPFDPSSALPKVGVADYIGQAKAIHVQDDSFSVVTDPIVTDAFHAGQSPKVASVPSSPPQWDSASVTSPPDLTQAYYAGVSEAIHVAAPAPHDWPPVDPVDSCDCADYGGSCDCGITDTFDDRTLSGTWGTMSNGENTWHNTTRAACEVAGGWGLYHLAYGGDYGGAIGCRELNDLSDPGTVEVTFTAQIQSISGSVIPYGSVGAPYVQVDGGTLGAANDVYKVVVYFDGHWTISTDHWDSTHGYAPRWSGTIDATQEFAVHVLLTGTTFSAEVWNTSGAAPGLLSSDPIDSSGSPTDFGTYPGLYITPYVGGNAGLSATLAMGTFDWVGHDRCAAAQFDNFNRTVADGWGNATPSGYAWVKNYTNCSAQVSSGSGSIANVSAAGNSSAYLETVGPGPWDGPCVMIARLWFPAIPTSTEWFSLEADTSSSLHVQGGLDPYGDGVRLYTGGSFVNASFAFLPGEVYWFELVCPAEAGATAELRVWAEGDARPSSPTVSTSVVAGGGDGVARTRVIAYIVNANTTAEMVVNYIDFDYAGRPCYLDCAGLGVLDDFQRTVASGFGDATPSGATWTVYESSRSDVIGEHAHVDPGDGLIVAWNANTITGNPTQNNVQAIVPASVTLPFTVTAVWSADAEFNATNWIGGSNSTPDPHDDVSMGDWWHGPPSQLFTIQLYMESGFLGMATAMDAAHGAHWGARLVGSSSYDYVAPATLTTYDFTPGQRYAFKARISDGLQQYKMWAVGTPEPDWQTSTAYSGFGNLEGLYFVPQRETLFLGSSAPAVGFYVHSVDFECVLVEGGGVGGSCADCQADGVDIPDFTPGYLPVFRRQIGDPTTNLDSYICTLESAAMVLDWHTRGAVQVWGGELIPWCGKSEADIYGASGSPGTSLSNARQAWLHWGQLLDVRAGETWADLMVCLAEGRAVVLQGDYGELPASESCQAGFEDNHAVSLYPYVEADRILVGDPLCYDFKGRRASSLQAYAEALGVAVYGVTSPQKILFAVSRPWAP